MAHPSPADVESAAAGDSPVHRLDARTKIVTLIGLAVVSASTPEGAWAAFGGYALLLVTATLLARLGVRHVARRMTVEVPFLGAAALLPVVVPDGAVLGGTVAAKATIGVLAVVVLSSTTPFPLLLDGFTRLRAPRLIVMLVAFTWRYLFVLVDQARRMRTARSARGYKPRWLWEAAGVARGIAVLFVRALERGERVHLAMTARGYAGGVPTAALASPPALRTVDAVVCVAGLGAVLAIRVIAV